MSPDELERRGPELLGAAERLLEFLDAPVRLATLTFHEEFCPALEPAGETCPTCDPIKVALVKHATAENPAVASAFAIS